MENTNAPLWPSVSTATALGPPAETETAKQRHKTISKSEITLTHTTVERSIKPYEPQLPLEGKKKNYNTYPPVGGAAA